MPEEANRAMLVWDRPSVQRLHAEGNGLTLPFFVSVSGGDGLRVKAALGQLVVGGRLPRPTVEQDLHPCSTLQAVALLGPLLVAQQRP